MGDFLTVAVVFIVVGALFGEIIFAAIFAGLAIAMMGGVLMLALAVRAYETAANWIATFIDRAKARRVQLARAASSKGGKDEQ